MTAEEWRICCSSVVGSSHVRIGKPCQDVSGYAWVDSPSGAVLLLYAADGAGSAALSLEGASQVCADFRDHFSQLLESGTAVSSIEESDCREWLDACRNNLLTRAEREGVHVREFSSTFLGAVIGHEECLFLQLGDGAIVVSCYEEPDEYDPVLWPEQGEYANMTCFVTSDSAIESLMVCSVRQDVCEVAILTDGLQRLALQIATKSAHAPFFRALFGQLRCQGPGYADQLAEHLGEFLVSPIILERTDDDKTLVLASRLGAKAKE